MKKKNSQEVLVDLVEKTKQQYVLLKLKQCYFATTFDLWMSKGAHDVFTMVINFMVRKLTELLDQYDLRKKIIAYANDEGANLNAMTIVLKSIVNWEVLGMEENFQGICFGHAFFKVCKDVQYVLIKTTQRDL